MGRIRPLQVLVYLLCFVCVFFIIYLQVSDINKIYKSEVFKTTAVSRSLAKGKKHRKLKHEKKPTTEQYQETKTRTLAELQAMARDSLKSCACKKERRLLSFLDYRVPKILHIVRFIPTKLSFLETVSLKSLLIQADPDKVYMHAMIGSPGLQQLGDYWKSLYEDPVHDLAKKLRIKGIPDFSEIQLFGKTGADLEAGQLYYKIFVLKKYGGIVADLNILAINPLDSIRSQISTVVSFDNSSTVLDFGLLMASDREAPVLETVMNRSLQPAQGFKEDVTTILEASSKYPTGILSSNPHPSHPPPDEFDGALAIRVDVPRDSYLIYTDDILEIEIENPKEDPNWWFIVVKDIWTSSSLELITENPSI